MKKQGLQKMLGFTLTMAVFLIVTVLVCVQYTSKRMTNFSFQRLKEMTEDAAREYKEMIETNYGILDSIAAMLAIEGVSDADFITTLFGAFSYKEEYISFQLLTKENMLLNEEGEWTDISDRVDFASESQGLPGLTGRVPDLLEEQRPVMRQAVPVVRDGETIAILYGVMALEAASKAYRINDFGGNAFVLVIDGETADVLLDTWHDSLGSLYDYQDRDFKLGDTVIEAIRKMKEDKSGDLALTSKTRGKTIYLHYEPVGYQHLSAIIGVKEEVAFEGTQLIVESLYTLAAVIFVALLIYTFALLFYMMRINRKIYRMSITDENTGVWNRSAYEACLLEKQLQVLPDITCIYVDANGLHELNNRFGHAAGDRMLQTVAQELQKSWPEGGVYRIGGDEFVVLLQNVKEESCRHKIQQLHERLGEQQYSVSIGFAHRKKETGLNRVIQEADADMLQNKEKYYAGQKDRKRPR